MVGVKVTLHRTSSKHMLPRFGWEKDYIIRPWHQFPSSRFASIPHYCHLLLDYLSSVPSDVPSSLCHSPHKTLYDGCHFLSSMDFLRFSNMALPELPRLLLRRQLLQSSLTQSHACCRSVVSPPLVHIVLSLSLK